MESCAARTHAHARSLDDGPALPQLMARRWVTHMDVYFTVLYYKCVSDCEYIRHNERGKLDGMMETHADEFIHAGTVGFDDEVIEKMERRTYSR